MLIVFFRDLFQFEFFGSGMCVQVSVGVHRTTASDSLELEWQLWTSCYVSWEPKAGPLQEQYALLSTEPSLQPEKIKF